MVKEDHFDPLDTWKDRIKRRFGGGDLGGTQGFNESGVDLNIDLG